MSVSQITIRLSNISILLKKERKKERKKENIKERKQDKETHRDKQSNKI